MSLASRRRKVARRSRFRDLFRSGHSLGAGLERLEDRLLLTTPPGDFDVLITTNTGSTVARGGTDPIAPTELTTVDSDTAASQLIYMVSTPPANGTLRLSGVATTSFSQADILNGLVTYVHNGTQTGSDSFTFSVTDGTTTVAGNTFNFTVTGVEGAPAVTTNTGSTVARGGTDTISSAELTTTDSNTAPELLIYTVTQGPFSGAIRLNGLQTSTFTQANINSGAVTYVHNNSATTGDNFRFNVSDGTTTLMNNTFLFTVTGVAGAPIITTNTGSTVARGGTDTISSTELATADSDTPPAQLTYSVTSAPANGTLLRAGVPTGSFTQADINAGSVTYTHNGSQTSSDSFTFSISDGQTILSGNTFAITVTNATGAPVITTNTGSTVARGSTDVITAGELNTTDSNSDPSQLFYTVTTSPANGILRVNGVPTNTFTQANINSGIVTYAHSGAQVGSDSFGFSVSDGTTTLPGNTFAFTVTGVSGAPSITTNAGSTAPRGGTDTITSSELSTSDSNTPPEQLIYTVTTAPANGMLRVGGLQSNTFTQANINAGQVAYVNNGSGANSDSFRFNVSDGTTTLINNLFNITVAGVPGAPVVTTNTGSTVARGTSDTITNSELATTDSNSSPEQLVYIVTTAPVNGTLRLGTSPTTVFTQAQINSGQLNYLHNGTQTPTDSFVFSVTDGTTNLPNNTFSIAVTGVAGQPMIVTNTGSTAVRGTSDTITTSELSTTDTNTPAAGLTYTVTQAPVNGILRLNGAPTTTFTQANIDAGAVTYLHNGGTTTSDSFRFTVSDGTSTLPANTFTFTVTAAPGTPVVSTNTGSTVARGATDTITISELNTTDTNSSPDQLVYIVTTTPVNGTLRLSGSPTSTFTQANINAGLVTYVHNGTQTPNDSFVFGVSDGTTTLPGNTFAIRVTGVEGQPTITTNTGSTVNRGGIDTITSSELSAIDSNSTPSQLVYTVTTAPANGTLRRGGVLTNTFTQADIDANQVTYLHNGSQANNDSFVFSLSDGTTTVPGNTFRLTVSGTPAITTNTGSTVTQGGTDVISSSELNASDTNSDASQLVYIVTTAPANGTLRLSGSATSTFTQANINAGLVTYVHNGSATTSDSFAFSLTDGSSSVAGTFNITVSSLGGLTVVNGKLMFEGTSENDTVTITGVGTGTGVFEVTAQRGTQPAQTQTASGVIDICVNLHGGNDRLTMNNIFVRGLIEIEMETGDDNVVLGNLTPVSSQGELRVDLGTGNDIIDGRRLFIGTNQTINGGDGNDNLLFDGFATPQFTLGTSAGGNASWFGGTGDDFVHVIYGFIVGRWIVDLGAGADTFDVFGSAVSGDVQAFGRAGNDSLRVDTNFFDANLLMEGNGEDDTLFLANGLGTNVGTIDGGDGVDLVTVRNQTTSLQQINTGAGRDTVDVRSSAFDRFFAVLGDGDDELTVRGNLSRLETDFDGGPGSADRLLDLGNSFFGAFRTRGFEL
jgi:hypothetical protein